ncbi:uncharacterized protein LOC126743130 isoform X2 [Anthonomus grandis grandis]|uniref:uncharacterized protein LOC126743130 isoform X2 n=1 Tax=Anthonomus grandis grandis TaxID=2921223 RepID=UPI002165A7D6|nr:uncharacterized protein LOC126743130 isoform X2 [Anthonomus grandis grandis]
MLKITPFEQRKSNVSIVHLRSTSEPWDRGPRPPYSSAAARSYFAASRSAATTSMPSSGPSLKKHQSLGSSRGSSTAHKWSTSPSFHSGSEVNSPGIFTFSGNYQRDMSPVRWCDREVDGVYLGKSGWVQVAQRSVEDNRNKANKASYSINLAKSLQSRRTGVKLANYHFYSEPSKCLSFSRTASIDSQAEKRLEARNEPSRPELPKIDVRRESNVDNFRSSHLQRPAALQLQTMNFERKHKSPSPLPEPSSPPSVTPIISPPPAFQDKTKSPVKSRTFFGKTPFLPRSNAIVDSDNSPPSSPIRGGKWITTAPNAPQQLTKPKQIVIRTSPGIEKPPRAFKKVPQTKSLEDTTATRRMQFKHQYGSSSSSSSSMGFRSLDSCLNRTNSVMPKLVENTDSSVDACGDADEEDNNSSSANTNVFNPNLLQAEFNRKLSPSGRAKTIHQRNQLRRSPAGSDTKPSPASSSSSSNECISRSSPTPQHPTVIRRNTARSQFQPPKPPIPDDPLSRVRRSRSLQLPERQPPTFERSQKLSPQHPDHRMKMAGDRLSYPPPTPPPSSTCDRPQNVSGKSSSIERTELMDEELLREAEVVAGFLYGNRSRAAAQALLMHRYNNNNISIDEKNKDSNLQSLNNELTVYYVGNNRNERQRVLLRGATSPSLPSNKSSFDNVKDNFEVKGPCSPEICAFWPHCAHRENISREPQYNMRSSQSYPSHQRSLDSVTTSDSSRSASTVIEKKSQEQYIPSQPSRRADSETRGARKPQQEYRRISPNRPSATGSSTRRNGAPEVPVLERKTSTRTGNLSGSSSGSDVWISGSRVSSIRGSRASTPVENYLDKDKTVLSRPGSAPMQEVPSDMLVPQQRSMSLPKTFLAGSDAFSGCRSGLYLQSGQISKNRHGTESLSSSPGIYRKIPIPEVAQTAPATPLHETRLGRSPIESERRPIATSTPHLSDSQRDSRRWSEQASGNSDESLSPSLSEEAAFNSNTSKNASESILQKFRQTISSHLSQRKLSKDSCASEDTASEALPSGEDSSPRHTSTIISIGGTCNTERDDNVKQSNQKYRFGPLVWHSSKERDKLNKAARSAKCNSGDSGIQIEIPGSCGGTSGESETYDTDRASFDNSPIFQRKPNRKALRPYSESTSKSWLNKADVKQQRHQSPRLSRPKEVRRTRSDLGGQQMPACYEQRQTAGRLLCSMESSKRPLSPRKRPPEGYPNVILRSKHNHDRRSNGLGLRRSLSQPIDIDKISAETVVKSPNFSEEEHEQHRVSRVSNTSDDGSDSDVSSVASLTRHKKNSHDPNNYEELLCIKAEAVFDHVAIEENELPFGAGDVIEVEDTHDREWWWGTNGSRHGWFPAQFVRLRVSQDDTVEDCLAAMASGRKVSMQIRRRPSISFLSNVEVRTKVVREIVETERDFVKVLRDITEGYMSQCKKNVHMFSDELISTIFINLEEIFEFQLDFLKDLENCMDWDAPYKSCIGECFLKHSDKFKIYSEYCNSHPMAIAELQQLYKNDAYREFFEACRMLQGVIEIPLDGHLLTPVQRICKYPLQLAELLKYTRTDHEDYANIKEALEVMRGVAMLINERKRRMESLEKLVAWQQRVDNWEGEDLIEVSSQLILQGDVVRVTTSQKPRWTNNVTLFLFDHQIVYCKKDMLKRNTYIYKGRIYLDNTKIIDVPDGKDPSLHLNYRNAIRIEIRNDNCLVFCCRSAEEKQTWLNAFEEERRLVTQDKNNGLDLPPSARDLARIASARQQRPPRKLTRGLNLKQQRGQISSSMLQLNVTPSNTHIGRKMVGWFFSGGKK